VRIPEDIYEYLAAGLWDREDKIAPRLRDVELQPGSYFSKKIA
jgi:hypothetical protein